jgi:hypothetical protein
MKNSFPENVNYGIFMKFWYVVDNNQSANSEEEMGSTKEYIFKTCPMCAKKWGCRDTFLDDPELNFNGYQANFGTIEQGLFFFTHVNAACGSTIALKAEVFLSLYNGKKYKENKQLSEECPKKCLDRSQLDRCPVHCEFAFIREVSQIIKDRSKKAIQTKGSLKN